jgi:hypothetical protein
MAKPRPREWSRFKPLKSEKLTDERSKLLCSNIKVERSKFYETHRKSRVSYTLQLWYSLAGGYYLEASYFRKARLKCSGGYG